MLEKAREQPGMGSTQVEYARFADDLVILIGPALESGVSGCWRGGQAATGGVGQDPGRGERGEDEDGRPHEGRKLRFPGIQVETGTWQEWDMATAIHAALQEEEGGRRRSVWSSRGPLPTGSPDLVKEYQPQAPRLGGLLPSGERVPVLLVHPLVGRTEGPTAPCAELETYRLRRSRAFASPGTRCAPRVSRAKVPRRSSRSDGRAPPCRLTHRSPWTRSARGTRRSWGPWACAQREGAENQSPPAPAERVEGRLATLAEWLEVAGPRDLAPDQAAAVALARLVEILPFDDANGRVSRLAASHLMVRGGMRPPILVSGDAARLRASLESAFRVETEPLLVSPRGPPVALST